MPQTPLRPLDIFWHKYLRRPYRLHVFDHGGTGKPVLIMLHGLASSSANWDPLIPLLKDNYRCITIDLVGFGASPKPSWYSYSIDEHVRDIQCTIQALKLAEPFILLGHSLGSLIATRYARQHQEMIERLILLSPPVYGPTDTIADRRARRRTSLYLKAYKFIRTNPRVTLDNFLRLSRILPVMKFLVIDRDSWIPFKRSLEQCIENQTILQDIIEVKAPIDIFYGLFDEVVIPYNVRQISSLRDVTMYPLRVNHIVGKRYASLVARQLAKNTTS